MRWEVQVLDAFFDAFEMKQKHQKRRLWWLWWLWWLSVFNSANVQLFVPRRKVLQDVHRASSMRRHVPLKVWVWSSASQWEDYVESWLMFFWPFVILVGLWTFLQVATLVVDQCVKWKGPGFTAFASTRTSGWCNLKPPDQVRQAIHHWQLAMRSRCAAKVRP